MKSFKELVLEQLNESTNLSPAEKKFVELRNEWENLHYKDPNFSEATKKIREEFSKLKNNLLKSFYEFCKSYLLIDKKKGYSGTEYFLGSLSYDLNEKYTFKLFNKKIFSSWTTIYNELSSKKIGDDSYKKAIQKAMDEVFGNGTWVELERKNKKIR